MTFDVTAPVRADLVVSSITAGTVMQGADLDFSYAVKNSGAADAGQSYAAFRVDQMPDVANWISYNSVGSLVAGGSETIHARFNTAGLGAGLHTLWVAADNWGYVGEANESNNWSSTTFNVVEPGIFTAGTLTMIGSTSPLVPPPISAFPQPDGSFLT